MKAFSRFLKLTTVALLVLGGFTGCQSYDDGGSSGIGGGYYGTGFYDPWYYGHYHDHDDIVVTPPGDRPNWPDRPVRPEQPIYNPSGSRPSTMPSIPSTPRAAPRGGGGGRR